MTQRRSFYLVLLIIGLGFALRLYQLDARPFWFDENITVDLAAAPPRYVFDTIDRPPVYYLLLHVWTGLVGSSLFTLRFFSVWWGTIALIFFYLLTRQLVDRRLSLWALLLATFSPFYVYYAQEARTYALTLALALISCWALLVWLKQRRARYLFLSATATLGCLYTHYSLLLLPFAQTVFVLLTLWRNRQQAQPSFTTPITLGLNFYVPLPHHLPKPKFKFSRKVRPLRQWLIVQAIVIVLFLPWPIHARYGLRELFAPQANPSPFTVLQQVANFVRTTLLEFSAGQPLGWPIGEAIALAFVGLIVLGLLSPALPRLSRRFLSSVLLLPPLIMLLLPRTTVYYAPKYLIMITPAFYILAVVGAEALWQARTHFFMRRVVAALGVMLLIGVPVLSIGYAAMQPFQADKTVQSFWEDDLHQPSAVNSSRNVAFTDEGVILSQLQALPPQAYSILSIDASGITYLNFLGKGYLLYEPQSGITREITAPYLGGLDYNIYSRWAIGSDGYWYGLMISTTSRDVKHLAQFDPNSGVTRDLGNVISTTNRLLVGPGDQVYGLPDCSWPVFRYDPHQDLLTALSFSSTASLPKYPCIANAVIGQDNWLYGRLGNPAATIFALNLSSGNLITRTMWVSAFAPHPGGGIYINDGQKFWIFEASGALTPLPAPTPEMRFSTDSLALRPNGHLIGRNRDYQLPYFFDYDPVTGAFRRLHSSADADKSILGVAPDNKLYTISGANLALIDSGQYTMTGSVLSEVIYPATLTLTDTVIGGHNASVAALACGQNGKVYGVKSDPATFKWLFEYDEQQPETAARQIAPTVSTEDKGRFLAGTALVPLSDGRLVGGTNNGHLFVYTPATDETWDVGQPVEGTQQIASLAVDDAGTVYGGTSSYEHRAVLFSFDPATGATQTIALPIVDPTLIGAVTVGPDERVYVGVDRNLVIYNPRAQQTTIVKAFEYDEGFYKRAVCTIRALIAGPDGQIYGGCGSHFFAYDPARDTLRDLGVTEDRGSIASLTIGSDKQIYGSVEHEYMSRSGTYRDNKIFVYALAERRMSNLGMAIKTGAVVLAACGDGTIYGGSNTTNSNYSGPAYLFAFRTDCPQGAIGSWDKVTWQAQTPPATRITMDVMSTHGTVVRNVGNSGSLQAIDAQKYPQLSLRANLFTSDPNVTPVLQSWRVDYTFACASQPTAGQR